MKSFVVLAFLAVVAVAYGTKCQDERAAAEANLKRGMIGGSLPACEDNGDYVALQFHPGTGYSTCVRPDGTAIHGPSRQIRACNCHRQKDIAVRRIEELKSANGGGPIFGAFVPQCEETGLFRSKQCHASTGMCWCAHGHSGEKLSEPTRAPLNC